MSDEDLKRYSQRCILEKDTLIDFSGIDRFDKTKLDNAQRPSEVVMKAKSDPNNLAKNKILYPFIFPPKGILSVDHIVLVAVDLSKHQIFYYDSQGLSSDDPQRKGITIADSKDRKDGEKFNMRADLEKLGDNLFPNEAFEIIENKEQHQSDPFNCGVFVMTAMKSLASGKTIEETAKHIESHLPRDLRRKLGENLLDNIAKTVIGQKSHETLSSLSDKKEKDEGGFTVL